jgi:hypothetical protein
MESYTRAEVEYMLGLIHDRYVEDMTPKAFIDRYLVRKSDSDWVILEILISNTEQMQQTIKWVLPKHFEYWLRENNIRVDYESIFKDTLFNQIIVVSRTSDKVKLDLIGRKIPQCLIGAYQTFLD